jgi:MoaA/NifB/PqqE/SkfB family radical SAM enzyme
MSKKPKKYSNLKIAWHPEKLKSFANETVTSPIFIRFKPTNRCNNNCFYCAYNADYTGMHPTTNRNDEISREKMLEILSDLKDMGVKSIIYSGGGEPLVYPYIEEALTKTIENGMHFAMITNGQNLKGRVAELLGKADWVRISLDYFNPELFGEIRRIDSSFFNQIKENIKRFVEIKEPTCNLGVNCVVHEKNRKFLYDIAKFCKDLGVETIRFSPVWNPNFIEYHKDSKDYVLRQIERIKEELSGDNFEVYESFSSELSSGGLSQRPYKKCFWMQINPVIAADYNVYTCHNKAYDPLGILGSIKDKSFKELWFSEEVAKKFKEFDASENCKHQCSSEGRNKIIAELLNCEETSYFV